MSDFNTGVPHRNILQKNIRKTLPRGDVKPVNLPGCPDIYLYLFDPEKLQGPLSHDEAQAVVELPAYWSFCWASGQALASYILANPSLVKGKRVVDFGCGSGIVSIAAKMAGASVVIACDIDLDALDAARANADLNRVSLEYSDDWFAIQDVIDVVVAADVLYDPENRVFLEEFASKSKQVVLGDSRIKNLADNRYQIKEVYTCRTWPDLHEFEEFNKVRIYTTTDFDG